MATSIPDERRVGLLTHNIKEQDLKPGDHIYVYRKGILYQHHGIYTGKAGDREVIHFTGPNDKKFAQPVITSSSLSDFLNGGTLRLVVYIKPESQSKIDHIFNKFKRRGVVHIRKCQSREEVVREAEHILDSPEDWETYHPVFNNCENFAYYCKTGVEVCDQRKKPESTEVVRSRSLQTGFGGKLRRIPQFFAPGLSKQTHNLQAGVAIKLCRRLPFATHETDN